MVVADLLAGQSFNVGHSMQVHSSHGPLYRKTMPYLAFNDSPTLNSFNSTQRLHPKPPYRRIHHQTRNTEVVAKS